jgi:hypothetical protein
MVEVEVVERLVYPGYAILPGSRLTFERMGKADALLRRGKVQLVVPAKKRVPKAKSLEDGGSSGEGGKSGDGESPSQS